MTRDREAATAGPDEEDAIGSGGPRWNGSGGSASTQLLETHREAIVESVPEPSMWWRWDDVVGGEPGQLDPSVAERIRGDRFERCDESGLWRSTPELWAAIGESGPKCGQARLPVEDDVGDGSGGSVRLHPAVRTDGSGRSSRPQQLRLDLEPADTEAVHRSLGPRQEVAAARSAVEQRNRCPADYQGQLRLEAFER